MQATTVRPITHKAAQEPCRCYRIERQFSSRRRLRELVRDLLRAHSGG